MNVLLVNPPIREWAKPNCFPEGLGVLAACLKKAGHHVEGLDINAHRYEKEEVANIIRKTDYDLVGMGGLVTVYPYMVWFSHICKELHPDKPVILGGNAVTPIPDLIMTHTSADIACVGEGEHTLVEVADAIEKGKPLDGIAGIWFRKQTGEIVENQPRPVIKDLDLIPWADRSVFPTEIYLQNAVGPINKDKWSGGTTNEETRKSFIVRVSRGCPYRCTFCYHDFMGQGFRMRSPEAIVDEIQYIHQRYDVTYFGLGDDLATANRRKFTRVCELLKERNLHIGFGTSARANLVQEDFLWMLKNAGCDAVSMGVESGSPKILEIMNKQVTLAQQKNAVRLVKKVFGTLVASFIVGYPGETLETVQETIDFCKEMELEPEVIFYATPYPGTWLYDQALQRGLITDQHAYLMDIGEQGERPAVNFTDWSDDELIAIKEKMAIELNASSKEFTADSNMTKRKVR